MKLLGHVLLCPVMCDFEPSRERQHVVEFNNKIERKFKETSFIKVSYILEM